MACACVQLCARGCCSRGHDHRQDHCRCRLTPPSLYAAVAIRCRRHRRHRRSRGGGDTRAARLGGARTGSSGGAARRRACRRLGRRARASDLTRRCERGSACAGRVTCATTRSFAARPRPPTLQEDTHQEVTHHVSSCGMACACAQARARLLRPRLRSPRPSRSSRSSPLSQPSPSPPPSRALTRRAHSKLAGTRLPARPAQACAWQRLRPAYGPRRRV